MTRALLERTVKTLKEHQANWSEETRLLVISIQSELAQTNSSPAWKESPNCEGLWIGPRNQVIAASGPLPAKEGELWFGPIPPEPEDK